MERDCLLGMTERRRAQGRQDDEVLGWNQGNDRKREDDK